MRRRLLDPQRVGVVEHATGVGEAGSAACGDLVRLSLSLENGRIAEARFQAYGCPAALAGGSFVAERVEGETLLAAATLSEEEVASRLAVADANRRCAGLAVEALHAALQDAASGDARLAPREAEPSGVLLGMSGGVDSSVAAILLREQGYRVVGVTFRLWSDPACGLDNACCSPEAVRGARRTAHALTLPHLMVDLSEGFYREVVEHFVEEYRAARTPNPCVRCNASLRFEELARLADRLGLPYIATGHYARLDHAAGRTRLMRGRDEWKDQSYVLAQVEGRLLDRLVLPLGDLTKEEVRRLARERCLEAHDLPESQEICFVPDDDYRRFLNARLGPQPGPIVDVTGRVLGSHEGLYNYTVGQRRGLGVAVGEPLYVAALRPGDRSLVVGPSDEAEANTVLVSGVVRHRDRLPERAVAQLRSSGGRIGATVRAEGDGLRLSLDRPMRGVAPGQQAVIYDGSVVAAAGTITTAQSR